MLLLRVGRPERVLKFLAFKPLLLLPHHRLLEIIEFSGGQVQIFLVTSEFSNWVILARVQVV